MGASAILKYHYFSYCFTYSLVQGLSSLTRARMRFEYELLCWDPKDGELWEQGCETQQKIWKKFRINFSFFNTCTFSKESHHKNINMQPLTLDSKITVAAVLLPEDSDSFQQIHLWSKIGYRSKSWNCYQKLLIQKYFCSINYKTNNNKKTYRNTTIGRL